MAHKTIELSIKGSSIVIKSKFDRDLITDIHAIPKEQRQWKDPEWIIALDDPNQQPDEETNLQYLQRICRENSERLGWKFIDYSSKSASEIQADKLKSQEGLIDEFLGVVDELPNYALKLVRWETENLQMQLNRYLSDDEGGYELFMRLYQASEQAYKPGAIWMSANERRDFGFIFTVPYRDRVIKKLLEKKTSSLKEVELNPIQVFDDEVIHFHNASGELWVGIPMDKSDPGSINWGSQDWQLTWHENRLYWVVEVKRYIYAWVEESKYGVAHFGGAFGVFFERPNRFPDKVRGFHLEDWLSRHIDEIVEMPPTCSSQRPWNYSPGAWSHPIEKFKSKMAIAPEILESIEQQKQELAKGKVESDRANAIKLAMNELRAKYTKDELLQKYGSQIQVKKSWTKDRILELICTQDFSEKLLEIPAKETTQCK